jgi:hypothetical protein
MINFFRRVFVRENPADPNVWHRHDLFWPMRCQDGSLTVKTWRRRNPAGDWEYRPYKETEQEFFNRQY